MISNIDIPLLSPNILQKLQAQRAEEKALQTARELEASGWIRFTR